MTRLSLTTRIELARARVDASALELRRACSTDARREAEARALDAVCRLGVLLGERDAKLARGVLP